MNSPWSFWVALAILAAATVFVIVVYAGTYLEETEDEDRWLP